MAIWAMERRFLVAFAEAVLGLADDELPLAAKAIDRLDTFLDAAPAGLRTNFHLALLVMPPGLFTKWRFRHKSLAWRRKFLHELFPKYAYTPPGLLIDRQAILATVKSMVGGAFAELPEFWSVLGYSPTPKAFPRRSNGEVVTPPSGPELTPKRTPVGQVLHDAASTVGQLPERFPKKTVAIIGSGAGGLATAHALSERPEFQDVQIVILEAGELRTNESFPTHTLDGFSQLFFSAGSTPCANNRIGFIQGRCVGGGTTVNNGGSPRPINEWGTIMRERWTQRGADLNWNDLSKSFDALEGPLNITRVEDYLITKSTQRAFDGFPGLPQYYTRAEVLKANLKDCIGCGQCNNGCRYDAHRTAHITLLPEALRRHKHIALVPNATVEKIVFGTNGAGRTVDHLEIKGPNGTQKLYADKVILAAGAFGSMDLLLRSGFISADGRRRLVGQRFSCNYASPVMGVFDEKLDGGAGIQIGYIVEIPDRRLIIETAFAPPTVFGMMLPQWGTEYARRARGYNNLAVAFPTVSSDAYGSVDITGGAPQIRFELEPTDWDRLSFGLKLCAIAMADAGAKELFDSRYTGEVLTISKNRAANRKMIEDHYTGVGPQTFFRVQSAHLQGGNVIHRDPTRGVVNADLKVHGVDNLWVFDSSVFPAPITLNIQYTTMALSRYAALRLPAI
ncbi:MAG: GMC family oxidoreductase N-terminal domain-containing protein [Gemmatimonadota bacterium]